MKTSVKTNTLTNSSVFLPPSIDAYCSPPCPLRQVSVFLFLPSFGVLEYFLRVSF